MPDPYIGEVRIWAGNFAPTGWAMCDGQIMSIAQNTALFSLLGVTYGGNGVTTFALPDLRGRVPIQPGQGAGLSSRARGEAGGAETHTLDVTQMPAHTHTAGASSGNGTSAAAAGNVPARSPAAIPQYAPTSDALLAPNAVGSAGGGQPHNNLQPYLALNFIIALQGMYPPRP